MVVRSVGSSSALELTRPNPLVAKQATPWKQHTGTFIDWDLLGWDFVEIQKPRYVEADGARLKITIKGPDKEEEHVAPKKKPRAYDDLYGDALYEDGGSNDMIRNADGTAYSPAGNANLYDPTSPDHKLMDCVDQEAIERSGAWVEYHRVTIDSRMDDLYLEQQQKVFMAPALRIKAIYEPVTPQILYGAGISPIFDSGEQMTFHFNRRQFTTMANELPRIGSLIKTCDEGVWWEIMENQINVPDSEREIWGKHRVSVLCKKYRPDLTDKSPSEQGREKAESGQGQPVRIR